MLSTKSVQGYCLVTFDCVKMMFDQMSCSNA